MILLVNMSLVPYISNIRYGNGIDFLEGFGYPKEIWDGMLHYVRI